MDRLRRPALGGHRVASANRLSGLQTLEARLELTGTLPRHQISDVDKDIVIAIMCLLLGADARTVVGVAPMKLPAKGAVRIL